MALAAVAVLWTGTAKAQSALPIVGFLHSGSPANLGPALPAFLDGLAESGYVDGRTVKIEWRWAEGRYDRLAALAADLVRLNPAAIHAGGGGATGTLAAKAATRTIPIVFAMSADPVKAGIVGNLGRPEANITGVSSLHTETEAKRLELMHQAFPKAANVAVLLNPSSAVAGSVTKDLETASRTVGLRIKIFRARSTSDIDAAYAVFAEQGIDAVLVTQDSIFSVERAHMIGLAARYRIPTIYSADEWPRAGGLLSYGAGNVEVYRRSGAYLGKILAGTKPADLPVYLATTFDLVINLKTAKTLGIMLPESLLLQADEVIE
jgi:putative ABC transport system substrate-binding protein